MSFFARAIAIAKRIDKVILYTAITVLVIGVPAILVRGYLKTPPFLFKIKERAEKNTAIKAVIGDCRGYTLSFSEKEIQAGDTARFAVHVIGKCDSAYALYKGIYTPIGKSFAYQVQDSLIVNKCH